MDLILWRHADAQDVPDDFPDLDRPLTRKGERQAQRMAAWLNLHIPETTRVLVSPSLRTRQTADALGRKYRLVPALGPDGHVEGLLQSARWPESREPVLIVGHQTTLGQTAALLLSGSLQTWSVRKGAIWWLRQREREGQPATTVLQTVLGPEWT